MTSSTPALVKTRRGWVVRLEDMPDLVTVDQAAAWLGCSVVTVRRMIHAGKLPRVKVGRLDRVPRLALVEILRASEGQA